MSRAKFWLVLALVSGALAGLGQLPGALSQLTTAAAAFPGPDGLQVSSQQCLSNGYARVNFAWTSYGSGPQWIDLSLSNNGFVPNTFVGLGPLVATQNQFTWDGLLPGVTHYARINSPVAGQWFPSNTAAFFTNACSPGPGSGVAGASNLTVLSQSCLDGGRVRLSAAWTASNNGEQWLDLSLANNGWVNGTFVSQGPIASGVSQQVWDGLLPNLTHFMRVNTGTFAGWIGSNTVSFTTANCPATPVDDFTTVAKSVNATTAAQVTLTRAEFAAYPADNYDRLVFTFDGGLPATSIQYVNQAQACGSGNNVPLGGVAILRARFTSTVAHNNSGGVTVNVTQISGSPEAIVEAKQICDFEGVVEWAIGTDRVAPFRVTALSNPARIVIDVRR